MDVCLIVQQTNAFLWFKNSFLLRATHCAKEDVVLIELPQILFRYVSCVSGKEASLRRGVRASNRQATGVTSDRLWQIVSSDWDGVITTDFFGT